MRTQASILGLLLLVSCAPAARQGAPAGQATAAAEKVELLDREVLFGNPDRGAPQISPDGSQVSFLAPDQGVMNVWVAPVDDLGKARVVTASRKRPIRTNFWGPASKRILYLQDQLSLIHI